MDVRWPLRTPIGFSRARRLSEAELDRAFGALADPTRRAIIARLTTGDAGVLELTARFPMTQPAITKHLKCWSRPA